MLSLESWEKGQTATIFKTGFLKDTRNTVTTTNIYSHIENYLNSSKYNDYYYTEKENEESENNNEPLPYDIFKDEEYEPHEYKEPPNNWEFIKISNRSGEYIRTQLGSLGNFSNMQRLNLYGLLKESKKPIDKLTTILTPLASNAAIRTNLRYLNIGNNNLIILNRSWTNAFNISTQYAKDATLINLIFRFINLIELNVSNNKISNVEAITAIISPKQAGQRQIPIINMANNLICNGRKFYIFSGENETERIISSIQKIIDNAIQNNGALTYLNISENNLDPNKINYSIYKRIQNSKASPDTILKIDVKNNNPRLMLKNFIKFIEKGKLPILDLSSINMKYTLPIIPTDDYVTNINIETYLKKYVGEDENGKDKDPIHILNDNHIVNYINALNDKSIGDQNLLIKRMSYEDRKLRLIDIINFHQIMMGLTENEKKQLCNEMVAYNAKILEANEADSTNMSITLGQSIDLPISFTHERGYQSGFEVGDVEKGAHSPWESYRIRKPDFGFPLQVLSTLLEKHDNSSFKFFERNQSLINSIIKGTNVNKLLCNFLEKVDNSFKNLNLSNCSINTNLFISICEAIKKNPQIELTHINLSNNDLTDDGMFYLRDVLEEKHSIRNINISKNMNVSNNGLAFMAQWLLTKDVMPAAGAGARAEVPPVNFVYSFSFKTSNPNLSNPNPNELDNVEKSKNLISILGLTRHNIYNLDKLTAHPLPAPAPRLSPTAIAAQDAVLMNLPTQRNLKSIINNVLREINNPVIAPVPDARRRLGGKINRNRRKKTIKRARRTHSYKKSNTYKKHKREKNKNSNKKMRCKKHIKKRKTLKKR